MIAPTQATIIEIFAFIAVLVFQLLRRKVLFKKTEATIKTVEKQATFLRKQQISQINYCKIIDGWNQKFSVYF